MTPKHDEHWWGLVQGFVYAQQQQCLNGGEYRTVVKGVGTSSETGPVLGGHDVVVEDLEQQLAQALQLLKEALPYEENMSGYHAEEWTARVRALLAEQPQEQP